MALSGSFYSNVGSHWRLQIEWSGSQSISGNYTNITAKMYWIGLDKYSAVYSSASKTSAIQYNNGSWSTESGSLAKLNAYQKKLINTYSFRVDHNNDGTATFNIDGYFDAEVTLAGTYYGRIDMAQKSFTLNTIPRASSLTSSPSWTAGSDIAVSVSRASSSFTHIARFYVNGVGISNVSFSTSATMKFSTAENTQIFNELNGGSSQDTEISIETYNGGTFIGSKKYTGTVTAPSESRLTTAFDHYVYVDQTITGELTRYNSAFTHTVKMTLGSFSKTLTNVGTSFSWNPSTSEENSLYAQMPNDTYKSGTIEVTTYYNGEKVRSTRSELLQFYVHNANPTFSSSSIDYQDTNADTTVITGDAKAIIQNQGEITAYINASATANRGSSFVKYIVSVAGVEKELTSATGSVVIGKIDEGSTQSLEVTAVDSRGLTTKVSKNITMIPYEEPKLIVTAERDNKFETTTRVDVSGIFSTITIGGVKKNLIQGLKYRKRIKGGTWESEQTINYTTSSNGFVGDNFAVELDNTKSWEFEITVDDKILSNTDLVTVGTGQPILFVDSEKNSLGVGKFPQYDKAVEIAGKMSVDDTAYFSKGLYSTGGHIDGNWWNLINVWEAKVGRIIASSGGKITGTLELDTSNYADGGGGGLDANNSDIIGLNGLYWNDELTSDNEALHFPKPGYVSLDKSTYDSFRVYDGTGYLNSKPMFTSDSEVLWEGVYYMYANQTVTPSKLLSDCPNGWVLVWSHYSGGEAGDYDWCYQVVPKSHNSGTGVWSIVGTHFDGITGKYVYVSNDKITGNDENSSSAGERNTVVLRKVLSY